MTKSSKFSWLWKFAEGFIRNKSTYRDIKNNPESRKVSTVMGKKSIGYTFTFLVLLALAVVLIYFGIGMIESIGFLLGVIMVVAGIGIAFYSLMYLILAFISAIMQLVLNRRAVGWIALSFVLLIVAIAVVGFILITKL